MRAVRSARLVDASTDDQMGRILDKTNTKLEEDEGRGRRNAIAHLRAAVQATEAERNMGGDLGADGRDTEVYRDDLETACGLAALWPRKAQRAPMRAALRRSSLLQSSASIRPSAKARCVRAV